MGKNKQKKFAEVRTFSNVFQIFDHQNPELVDKDLNIINNKGRWRNNYFKNDNPIILELACGKGDYSLALANHYPNQNFIGIDIKGARIWTGAKRALENDLKNVAFIRMRIENITGVFGKNEIDEIWITFPDPFPRGTKVRRRLTAPNFLKLYEEILKPGGIIHLKTDSDLLYDFTKEVIESAGLPRVRDIQNIYEMNEVPEILSIKTFYEKQHLAEGRTIKYISFKLRDNGN